MIGASSPTAVAVVRGMGSRRAKRWDFLVAMSSLRKTHVFDVGAALCGRPATLRKQGGHTGPPLQNTPYSVANTTLMSVRRLSCLPASVALSATGLAAPWPMVWKRAG